MMVLNNICEECNEICDSIYFQRNFKSWTSGNDDIDKFIQDTQLSAHENAETALEWIPYNRFNNIEKSSIDKVHKANWIDGRIYKWDDENQNWKRNSNMIVTLKRLNNQKNFISPLYRSELKGINHKNVLIPKTDVS